MDLELGLINMFMWLKHFILLLCEGSPCDPMWFVSLLQRLTKSHHLLLVENETCKSNNENKFFRNETSSRAIKEEMEDGKHELVATFVTIDLK